MLQGALKSKTVWWNVLLAVFGGLELIGGHMTVLWGQEVAAAILMVGALANLVLRTVTTQALSEK
jgi:hypothetical protein